MTSLTSLKSVNILITGANRGIGIGLVREILKQVKGVNNLFAGCRNPDEAKELQTLSSQNPSVKIVKIDVSSDESIRVAAEKIGNQVKDIHLLINNAGIFEKEKGFSIHQPNRDIFQKHFDINSTGAAIVTSNFLPFLLTAASSGFSPLVVNISSILGCISRIVPISSLENKSVIYGMSKAALNYYTKALSLEEPKLITVALHPGWVKTEMGGDNALLSIEEASSAIIKRICLLKKEDSGKFMDSKMDLTP
uniref:C-factor n=1 Tax=Meloidogyne floridensis TaxID=298350 RepID=A0A915P7M1_9BILA